MPKISIVTISYNSIRCIENCIQSIVGQSYNDKEFIVIDGGSTDGTLSVIEKYKDQIDYFVSEPDKGISDAFNKGIKAATGDVVVFINSDDLLVENALEIFAKYYDPAIDVYCGNVILWNSKTNYKALGAALIEFPHIPFKYRLWHQAVYIRKSAYERYGLYNVDLRYIMDLDLVMRMYQNKASFKKIPETLAVFQLGGISQSSTAKLWAERKKVILDNGGTKLDAIIWISYLKIRTFIKNIVSLFGEDLRLLFVNKRYK
ncbi:glycosyltransferase family 2 protein [Flavobacterium denitrificans]|uniref:glycosyltransferase family 2 protein n=1 Tax=Flavobacterium denitrificans TaxID=281361 RepID=UPI00041389F9|nr:glycosyltransferase family 2 protein [Flavobacterium denitrificans]